MALNHKDLTKLENFLAESGLCLIDTNILPKDDDVMSLAVKYFDKQSKWIGYGIISNIDDKTICDLICDYYNESKDKIELDNLLITACYKGTEVVIKQIITLGADINAKSIHKSTPLMFIAERDMLNMFKYLLDKGANMSIKNIEDHDAEYFAICSSLKNNGEVYSYIQELKCLERCKEKIKDLENELRLLELSKQYEGKIRKLRNEIRLLKSPINKEKELLFNSDNELELNSSEKLESEDISSCESSFIYNKNKTEDEDKIISDRDDKKELKDIIKQIVIELLNSNDKTK